MSSTPPPPSSSSVSRFQPRQSPHLATFDPPFSQSTNANDNAYNDAAAKKNRGTRLPGDLGMWNAHVRLRAPSPEAAYKTALRLERLQPKPINASNSVGVTTDRDTYRLYAVHVQTADRDPMPFGACVVRADRHVVIGRHSSCDLVLPDNENVISLRHVLVRTTSLDDGLSLLEVLDVESGLGFHLSNGSQQRAVVATGPIVFRVGTIWIVALPIGIDLDDELPSPVIRQADANKPNANAKVGRGLELAEMASAQLANPNPYRKTTSQISIVPHSVRLSETFNNGIAALDPHYRWSPQSGMERVPQPIHNDFTRVAFALILSDKQTGRQAGVLLSERDVTHGVLIGRDERCVDQGLRAIFDINISRVHALLIRERMGIRLYDVASMNGTSQINPANGLAEAARSVLFDTHQKTAVLANRILVLVRPLKG